MKDALKSWILLDPVINGGCDGLRVQIHVTHAQIVEKADFPGREERTSPEALPINVWDHPRHVALRERS